MNDLLDFRGIPELADLAIDRRPVWLWSDTGTELLWCNPAAARALGVGRNRVFRDIKPSPKSTTAGHIERFAKRSAPGHQSLEQLRFQTGFRFQSVPCLCTKVQMNDGSSAVLAQSMAEDPKSPADPAARMQEFAAFGDAAQTYAVVSNGEVLQNPSEVADADLLAALENAKNLDTVTTVPAAAIDGVDGRPVQMIVWTGALPSVANAEPAAEPDLAETPEIRADDVIVEEPATAAEPTATEITEEAESESSTGDDTVASAPDAAETKSPVTEDDTADTVAERDPEPTRDEIAVEDRVTEVKDTAPDEITSPATEPESGSRPSTPIARRSTYKFVWRMDADLRFTLVSPDLGDAVGEETANILGLDWSSVRDKLSLDPDNRVEAALLKRDTWSGETVDWPISDEAKRIPTDLSALPAFDRDRTFQGYRGFGVCRFSDAYEDPNLKPGPPSGPPPTSPTPEDGGSGMEGPTTGDRKSGEANEKPAASGSEPAARLVREETDRESTASEKKHNASDEKATDDRGSNVVALPINRQPDDEEIVSLSKPEQDAFRQIAKALGARIEDEAAAPADEDGDKKEANKGETDQAAKRRAEAKRLRRARETAPDRIPSAFAPGAAKVDKQLIDRLPVGVLVCRENEILFANETLLDMVDHVDLAELKSAGGLNDLFVEHGDLARKPRDDKPSDRSVALRRRDGDSIPVDARLYRVPWNRGSALMITVKEAAPPSRPARDRDEGSVDVIASALAGREAAEDRAAELETILETATDGVVVMNRQAKIVTVNRSAEALFGAGRDQLVGEAMTSFLAQESRRPFLDYLDGLADNGVASVLNDGREIIAQVDENAFLPLFVTIGRLGTGDGSKFCAVLRDITQWKKAEEELLNAKRQAEDASSQKSDFLARISHEIRTPLNAIIGFSEVMMEERFGEVGNAKYREYLADIHTSGAHIMSLINDLLDLSKIEAGKMEMSFEAVNLEEVIGECVALMQPQANRDRVIIRSSLPKAVPQVVADLRSIRQIILNLLSNAVKFNVAGGQVIVSTSLEETGEVMLRVRDTGVGMSDRDVAAALEPFRQLHTTRSGTSGSGLGLPLTKALVEANRASFRIESAVNEGTLIQITFPTTRVLAE